MNFIKNSKGITLIALVITIIVLLILAGVSIKLIFGSEGLLGKAIASVDTHNIGTAKEQVELKITELKSEYYEKKYATAEIEIDVQSGDWIFNQCEGNPIDTEDYQFTITLPTGKETADAENPYIVTILKSKKLPSKVTGTLSIDGILTWDENFLADSGDEGGNENPVEHGTTMESKGSITIGSVTYSESYEIWNKSQLEDFRNKVNNGEKFENCIITQKADVSLSSVSNWTPIGNETNYFSGTYDGADHTIKDIKTSGEHVYEGLFGVVKNGTIKNTTVAGNVKQGAITGAIVGRIIGGNIDHCTNEATMTKDNTNYISLAEWYSGSTGSLTITFVGGIVGVVDGSTSITNSTNNGVIEVKAVGSEYTDAGGIVGWVTNKQIGTKIEDCKNIAKIEATSISANTRGVRIGGIVGVWDGAEVRRCSNSGDLCTAETSNITDFPVIGGIIAMLDLTDTSNQNNIVEECWNSGRLESTYVGGIIGDVFGSNNFILKNSYNVGTIVCNSKCGGTDEWATTGGGVVWWLQSGTVERCYNKGEIEIKSQYTTDKLKRSNRRSDRTK